MIRLVKFRQNILSTLKNIGALPLYPLLIAVYPIFFLYLYNISELSINVVFTPLLVALILTIVAMFSLNLIFRNWYKTAVIASLILFIFYFYQPIVLLLPHELARLGDMPITRGKILLPLITLGFAFVALIVYFKPSTYLQKITKPLNMLILLLVGFSVVQISNVEMVRIVNGNHDVDKVSVEDIEHYSDTKPDIYYIIFDRYAGQNTLNNYYEFDNSRFLNALIDEGFYVADESHTNYPSTELSIGSTLDMSYHLSNEQVGRKQDFTTDLYPKIQNAKAFSALQDLGYSYYQVASHYNVTQFSNIANKVYIPKSKSKWHLDEFTVQLLETTMVNVIGRDLLHDVVNLDKYQSFLNAHSYQRIVMPKIINKPGPKAVFAHVLLPHDPYVVNSNCEALPESKFSMGTPLPAYLDQLQCANKLALEWIELINRQSSGKAIIVIQADEGPYPIVNKMVQQKNFTNASVDAIKERTHILNAYYFPGKDYKELYRSITPVNTFRTILRQYFNMNIPNIEDKVFVFPNQGSYFDFIDATDRATAVGQDKVE